MEIISLRDIANAGSVAPTLHAFKTFEDTQEVRPWPPVIIRAFVRSTKSPVLKVQRIVSIGEVADYLSGSRDAVVAVYNDDRFIGAMVDDDMMALIKRDGVRALDYSADTPLQVNRPVVSITDSPYVVLQIMKEGAWDRVTVSERGKIIGLVRRRDLIRFVES